MRRRERLTPRPTGFFTDGERRAFGIVAVLLVGAAFLVPVSLMADEPPESSVLKTLDTAETDAKVDRLTRAQARISHRLDLIRRDLAALKRKVERDRKRRSRRQREVSAVEPAAPEPTTPEPEIGAPWAALAECESSGDWSYNGPSGYDGGLQFSPSTWTAYGGAEYAPAAYLATPAEQIAVAERVLEGQGWGAWPACSAKLGLR